jgi:crossover junction endodeoxyribonuclease RusA
MEIELPRPPSVNRLWRISGKRLYRSAQYMDWLNLSMAILKEAGFTAIKGKYKIIIRVARPDKRRRDIDNFVKATQDLLERAGVIEDDCLCEAVLCRWVEKGPPMRINIYSVRGTDELQRSDELTLQGRARKDQRGGAAKTETPAAAYARLLREGARAGKSAKRRVAVARG